MGGGRERERERERVAGGSHSRESPESLKRAKSESEESLKI